MNKSTKWGFALYTSYFFILQALFDVLMISGAYGHGAWWLFASLLSKAASSMALASITLVCRRRWPIAVIASLLAIWIVASGMYHHATGLYITYDVMRMAGGLRGFTSSLATYFQWDVILLLCLSLLIIPLLIFVWPRHSWKRFGRVWCSIIICSLIGCFCHYLYVHEHDHPMPKITADYFRLFDFYGDDKPDLWRDGENWYIERHSIAMAFPHILVHAYNQHKEEAQNANIKLTEAEKQFMHCRTLSKPDKLEGNLVIILVESLESWTLNQKDTHGQDVLPCLNRYIATHPMLISREVESQKRYGESGDGQLIVNSGLLPIHEGVACMKYPNKTYPNFAHLYPKSFLVNPMKNCWNQTIMTERYGYKTLVEPDDISLKATYNDAQVMQHVIEILDTVMQPTCLMALTISSHTPFDRIEPTLQLPANLDQEHNHYLQCLHYADSCIGRFLSWADTSRQMRNATIVITGDHNIFPDGWIPLIITSPSIKNTQIIGYCYQMDIYPTILGCIGQRNQSWQGFGIDLLKGSDTERPIDIDSAYILSDKLIRMNYFSRH